MDFRNLSISSMIPSTSLFFDINNIKKLSEASIEPNPGRLVWMKSKPPEIIALDKFIRRKFELPTKSKMIFNLYRPPTTKKNILIEKPKHKLTARIILSTIPESPEITVMGRTEKMKMKKDEAYIISEPVAHMITFDFDSSRTLIIPARKGFRQQRMTKKVENRYIMVFDYIYTDEIKQAVSELIGKDEELRFDDRPDTTTGKQESQEQSPQVNISDDA